jgi:hypothetical protein
MDSRNGSKIVLIVTVIAGLAFFATFFSLMPHYDNALMTLSVGIFMILGGTSAWFFTMLIALALGGLSKDVMVSK